MKLETLANLAQILSLLVAILAWLWPNPGSNQTAFRILFVLAYIVYALITVLLHFKPTKPGWNLARWIGLCLFTGGFAFLVGQQCSTTSGFCDQVDVVAIPEDITVSAPNEERGDEGTWADISYEITAPDNASMRILLHWAQHLVNDGTRQVETVSGHHFTHENTHVPAGQTIKLNDGIWIEFKDIESAKEYQTTLMTHRLTFYMVSEQGYFCEKPAEVQVRITGILP